MGTPTITYIAAYATAATALGTTGLATATYYLARKTKATADAAQNELVQAVEQSKATGKQTEAVIAQAEAVKQQSQATAQQVELLKDRRPLPIIRAMLRRRHSTRRSSR